MSYAKKLEEIGFSKQEARVYLMCLKLGEAKISEISKEVDIPRTSLYIYTKNLLEKGYLKKSKKKNNEYLIATEPRVILEDTKDKIENFVKILPALENLVDFQEKKPKIQYFDTKGGFFKMYKILLTTKIELTPFFIEAGPAVKSMVEKKEFNDVNFKFQEEFLKKNIPTQGVITESSIPIINSVSGKAKKIFKKRKINTRVVRDEDFPLSIFLYLFYPNSTFIIVPQNDFVLMIEDEYIYQTFLALVKLLYSKGRPFDLEKEMI